MPLIQPGSNMKEVFRATIENGKPVIADKIGFAELLSKMEGKDVVITISNIAKQRTLSQNAAIHLYFKLLASAFNEAGLDVRQVFKPEAEIPVTETLVKDQMWRPIQRAITNKESTTRLTTDEVNKVYEVIHRHVAEKFGINVPFPSYDFGEFV